MLSTVVIGEGARVARADSVAICLAYWAFYSILVYKVDAYNVTVPVLGVPVRQVWVSDFEGCVVWSWGLGVGGCGLRVWDWGLRVRF
jgi:hypothetical protein